MFLTVLPADLVDPVMSRDYASKRKADLTSNRAAAPRIISSLRDFPVSSTEATENYSRDVFLLSTSSRHLPVWKKKKKSNA